jgi:hypothetical protein
MLTFIIYVTIKKISLAKHARLASQNNERSKFRDTSRWGGVREMMGWGR